MTTPHLVMWAVVVGLFAAWRNPTALALVMAWLAGEAACLITGDSLPVQFYLFPDIAVLAVIMCKPEWCSQQPYESTLHQLKCILIERSPSDRIVMAIFPVMWLIYVAPVHAYYAWWLLYALVLAQFAAAGWGSYSKFRRERAVIERPDISDSPGTMLVAYGGRGYG